MGVLRRRVRFQCARTHTFFHFTLLRAGQVPDEQRYSHASLRATQAGFERKGGA